jgi:hypothetical protein
VHVTLPLADFNLIPSSTSPHDRFDPADLGSIRFQDLTRYRAPANALTPRRLLINSLEFVTQRVSSRYESRSFAAGRGVTLDTFDHEALEWEVGTNVAARTVTLDAEHTVARLTYRQAKGERTPELITHLQGARLMPDMKSLRLVARSRHEAQLRISFMEYRPEFQSVPYEATITLPPGDEWKPYYIPYDAFKLAAGARDDNSRFDPAKVWMVRLADVTAPEQPVDNVLELDELAVIRGR